MANDRMYLVNKKTKHCVCIAVRFGGGWKRWTDDQAEVMYQALADEVGVFGAGLGSQAWCIEYEHANDDSPGPEHDWRSCLTCTSKYKIGQRYDVRTVDSWYPDDDEPMGPYTQCGGCNGYGCDRCMPHVHTGEDK